MHIQTLILPPLHYTSPMPSWTPQKTPLLKERCKSTTLLH